MTAPCGIDVTFNLDWPRSKALLGQDSFSRYHGEAAIQIEHVLSPSFGDTRFGEIVALYETIERMEPSPLYALNRVIALAEVEGAAAALEHLRRDAFPAWFRDHYLYQGTLGELSRRDRRQEAARFHLLRAAAGAPSRAEREFFEQRAACTPLRRLSSPSSSVRERRARARAQKTRAQTATGCRRFPSS